MQGRTRKAKSAREPNAFCRRRAKKVGRGAMKVFTISGCVALVALSAWSPVAFAQQKTVRECRAEWSVHKGEFAASGKTQRIFVAECRGVPLATAAKQVAELAQGQFASESEAKSSCSSEAIVWVNFNSGVSHSTGSKSYGTTKNGAFMCEKASIAAGFRAPKAPPAKPATT
jgi:hypothetical protein